MRSAVAAVALVALLAATAVAAGPGERCAASKLRAAGQKAKSRFQCHARALLHGTSPEACLAKTESKLSSAWARIEARGGCATTNDVADVEARVDAFVDDLVAALPPTTTTTGTTTTPTSSCPPLTALYCGISSCGPFPPALCPPGMTCVTTPTFCACQGDPIPCSSLNGNFCRWGTCPVGTTCGTDPDSTVCPRGCSCR
jgi:hypothetical protein